MPIGRACYHYACGVKVEEGRFVERETEHGTDRRMFGEFIGSRGELASYAFGWTSEADEGRISIGVGAGDEGGGTFHAAVVERDGRIGYALIEEPFEDVPQGGPHLTAAAAHAHQDIAFIWAVVDAVMELDSRAVWLRHSLRRTKILTTAPVLSGEEPALFISRDADDGLWQLIGASKATIDNNRVGHLTDLVDTDQTLVTVLDLEPGESAMREQAGGPWARCDVDSRPLNRPGPFLRGSR
ncbi:hypothetical protein ACW14X_24555 [Nocardioides sp. YJ-D4]